MRVFTFDTTLRDGEQCEGVNLSLEDKLLIARKLDRFGIDYIEGGFPASNDKDIAFFKELREKPLDHARLVVFGNTCKKDVSVEQDTCMRNILASGAPAAAIVGKAWDAQVTRALQTTLDENLRMIADSVGYLKHKGLEVIFDAEHFFDGYHANPEYAFKCIRAAHVAGADWVCLCDTNGGMLPADIKEVVDVAVEEFPKQKFAIHCHNDTGCAVANALTAVNSGATQVQGTINGIGERVGNTDLITVIADLELKMGVETVGLDNLRYLRHVSKYVAEVTNKRLPANHPYTGRSAFAHKGGLHASAMMRFEGAYNHIDPEMIGNGARMIVSELSGKATLLQKALSLGFNLEEGEVDVQALLGNIKDRATKGYTYEVADGSLALLIMRHIGTYEPAFSLESFRVIVDDREDAGSLSKDATSEATIKIHVGDSRFIATGEGKGPVGALDSALRMALKESYPEVAGMKLVDYKVRLPDESQGTGAITRVTITTQDEYGKYGTIGVSENVIEASWNALVESIEWGLIRKREYEQRKVQQ